MVKDILLFDIGLKDTISCKKEVLFYLIFVMKGIFGDILNIKSIFNGDILFSFILLLKICVKDYRMD